MTAEAYNMREEIPSQFSPIPPGRYNVRCTDAEITESASGNDMIKCTYEIFGEKFAGRKLWDNVVWSVRWKVAEVASVADPALMKSTSMTIQDLHKSLKKGPAFSVQVTTESYTKQDGTTGVQNRMKAFKPIVPDQEEEDLDDMFK